MADQGTLKPLKPSDFDVRFFILPSASVVIREGSRVVDDYNMGLQG